MKLLAVGIVAFVLVGGCDQVEGLRCYVCEYNKGRGLNDDTCTPENFNPNTNDTVECPEDSRCYAIGGQRGDGEGVFADRHFYRGCTSTSDLGLGYYAPDEVDCGGRGHCCDGDLCNGPDLTINECFSCTYPGDGSDYWPMLSEDEDFCSPGKLDPSSLFVYKTTCSSQCYVRYYASSAVRGCVPSDTRYYYTDFECGDLSVCCKGSLCNAEKTELGGAQSYTGMPVVMIAMMTLAITALFFY